VEDKSGGRWKAVVVGSYERGDRAVTVARLAELADFYGVPVTALLPGDSGGLGSLEPARVRLDLAALAEVAAVDDAAAPLARYAATIQAQREDYNGRILSIRDDDVRALAAIYDETPAQLTERLRRWGVLHPLSLDEGSAAHD
jgi:transcriptional regulator with XRE-family HTH domain